jgi:hypothetical protein
VRLFPPVRRGRACLAYKHNTRLASYRDCADLWRARHVDFSTRDAVIGLVRNARGSVFNACHSKMKITHNTEAPAMGFESSSSQHNRNQITLFAAARTPGSTRSLTLLVWQGLVRLDAWWCCHWSVRMTSCKSAAALCRNTIWSLTRASPGTQVPHSKRTSNRVPC